MHMRTRRFVAHFSTAFRLAGVDGLLPAGAYALDQEEEPVSAGCGVGYRRVGMFMHLPAVSEGLWTMRLVSVEPADVEAAILESMERADGHPIA
jgi:hypothetical protein